MHHDTRHGILWQAFVWVSWCLLGMACSDHALPVEQVAEEAPHAASLPTQTSSQAAPASADWTAEVQKRMAHGERAIRTDGTNEFRVTNRQQGLSGRFDAAGALRVEARSSVSGAPAVQMQLASVGREGMAQPVGVTSLALGACASDGVVDEMGACLKRLEVQRDGVVEWWESRENGLEQGFVFENRPAGEGLLALHVAVEGAQVEVSGDHATGATLRVDERTAWSYAGLAAVDAHGKTLESWMERDDAGGIRIVVDDEQAAYPVVVDPVLSAGADWMAESDQADAVFGYSVASAGDVNGDGFGDVIVGAPYYYDNGQTNEGRAFVYLGSASGLETTAAWTAESDQANAKFGTSVASAGDVNGDGYSDIIVGAPNYSYNGQSAKIWAFVFHGPLDASKSPGTPTNANWKAGPSSGSTQFGISVATAGDVNGDGYSDVIIGARYSGNDAGRVYVYWGGINGLLDPATNSPWTAESDKAGAHFGISVSSAGDVDGDGFGDVIVGAAYYDNGQTDEGRAYLYLGSASGLATTAAWTAESDQAYANFGRSVASAGDVNGDGFGDVIIGARGYDADAGRAFVYLGSASGLQTTAGWTAQSGQENAYFGYSVASAGDLNGDGFGDVIVGAYGHSIGHTDEGRAYVYLGSNLGLKTTVAWATEPDSNGAFFGWSVASAGDVNGDGFGDVIVGAPGYNSGQTDEGRAFVYLGSDSGIQTSAVWAAESNQSSAYFGWSVASAGDVNGDGFGDVIVGAPGYNNPEPNEGRAYVYLGSAKGLAATAAWTAESDQAGAEFGHSVASAGDVNGDGFGDVIIAADGLKKAYVYLGSAAGLALTAAWTAESDQPGADFGLPVASAGDVNGDGFGDVIVGAEDYGNGQSNEGRAFVYLGSATGLGTTAAWTAESDQTNAHFGRSVASAGDVNGDGFGDVIVGAYNYENGQADEGRAYLYLGSASGLAATAAWTAESDQVGARFGYSVAGAGDVNGDGFGDVIVGAYNYDNGQADEGRAYLYLGSPSGLETTAAWTAESDQPGAQFGYPVASAGDVNGDGYGDVIVSARRYENGQVDEGRVYVYLGSALGLGATPVWTAESNQTEAYFGRSAASAGDVNGDGFADIIVGAPYYDGGNTDEGRAFVYSMPSTGRPNLRLSDPAANHPLQPWNALFVPSVRATGVGATPFGRMGVKAEVEVKPLGVAFNGQGTTLSPSWTPGFSGGAFQDLVTDVSLVQAKPHHLRWRLRYRPSDGRPGVASRWIYAPQSGDARGVHFRFGVCGNGLLDGDEVCDDGNVSTGDGCNAACKWENGIGCTPNSASSCGSGFCADGVCCNSACAGPCQACSAQLKGSGTDGECGNFAAGTDPEDECVTDPESTCQQDGVCDGNGACRLWANGTSCGSNACAGNVSKLATCDGFGLCLLDPVGTDCGVNGCDPATGQCMTGCTSDADCTADAYCDTSMGQCKPKATLGTACTASAQCQSGHCVDNVCCIEACDGTCQACGADGFCGNVAAGTTDAACAADPMKPCGFTGVCTGVGACAWADAAAGGDCAPPSCTNGVAQSSSCDGSGKCVVTTTTPCGNYQCDATTCKTTCTSDQHCIANAYCDNGQCKPKTIVNCASDCKGPCETGVCTVAGTCELKPAGQTCGTPTCANGYQSGKSVCDDKGACVIIASTAKDCSPYQCSEDSISCKTSCSTNSDCFGGYTCRNGVCSTSSCETQPCLEGETCDPATKTCIAATTMAPSCTCQTPGSSGADPRWSMTSLAFALLMVRRSRSIASRRGTQS